MKGLLQKTDWGWQVTYQVINSSRTLPLHPEDVDIMPFRGQLLNNQHIMDGKEVEFEVVTEYTDIHTNEVQRYAKLVTPSIDEVRTDSPMVKRLKEHLDSITPEQFQQEIDEIENELGIEDDGLTDDEWIIKQNHQQIAITAIDFAKWISGKYSFGNILGKWYLHENTNNQYTEEELYQLYLNSQNEE